METTQEKQRTHSQGGKRFKLTVKSAEEAVRVIRDKLGETGKSFVSTTGWRRGIEKIYNIS